VEQPGVQDIIVFDPRTLLVLHIRKGHASRQISPIAIELQCGYVVSV
jgi:hypothetical protein